MSLRDWLRAGWLAEHTSSREEISDLLGVADRDLGDCRTAGLSADWRFNIAYNAALQAATAALAAAGFRASRQSHHHRVIQSLAHTIGLNAASILRFDAFRKKRNISGYEAAGHISEQEADEVAEFAEELRERVGAWLSTHHPELLR